MKRMHLTIFSLLILGMGITLGATMMMLFSSGDVVETIIEVPVETIVYEEVIVEVPVEVTLDFPCPTLRFPNPEQGYSAIAINLDYTIGGYEVWDYTSVQSGSSCGEFYPYDAYENELYKWRIVIDSCNGAIGNKEIVYLNVNNQLLTVDEAISLSFITTTDLDMSGYFEKVEK